MKRNLIFTGVGGQGVLLAANVVGEAATAAGYETRIGEIHGMSQRGGSVIAHVRYGDGVYGPTVPDGTADAMLALEPMEALRHLTYLGEGNPLFVNFDTEMPFPVEHGDAEYPDETTLREELGRRADVREVDATTLASESGTPQAANVVLLGALFAAVDLGIDRQYVLDAVRSLVPADAVDANLEAFERGQRDAPAK